MKESAFFYCFTAASFTDWLIDLCTKQEGRRILAIRIRVNIAALACRCSIHRPVSVVSAPEPTISAPTASSVSVFIIFCFNESRITNPRNLPPDTDSDTACFSSAGRLSATPRSAARTKAARSVHCHLKQPISKFLHRTGCIFLFAYCFRVTLPHTNCSPYNCFSLPIFL